MTAYREPDYKALAEDLEAQLDELEIRLEKMMEKEKKAWPRSRRLYVGGLVWAAVGISAIVGLSYHFKGVDGLIVSAGIIGILIAIVGAFFSFMEADIAAVEERSRRR